MKTIKQLLPKLDEFPSICPRVESACLYASGDVVKSIHKQQKLVRIQKIFITFLWFQDDRPRVKDEKKAIL